MVSLYRYLFLSHALPGHEDAAERVVAERISALGARVAAGELMTASAYRFGARMFVYYESVGAPVDIHELLGDLSSVLAAWPGEGAPRWFAPMMDIYHCGEPLDAEYWRRNRPVEQLLGRVVRLKPEQVSSYIFYHYQLQEEQPGSFDKYGLIGIHENLLFFYMEMPPVLETPPKPGRLSTRNTPDDWQAAMFPHFMPWADSAGADDLWREARLIASAS